MIVQVRPKDLKTWIDSMRAFGLAQVIDVREPAELRTASIQADDSFTLLAIPMASIPARLAELDPQKPVACLCHHGGRSMQVASFLHGRGFAHVANIAGGIHAWADEVDPSLPRY
jgi:rhodanese-related sulfurtransferase